MGYRGDLNVVRFSNERKYSDNNVRDREDVNN